MIAPLLRGLFESLLRLYYPDIAVDGRAHVPPAGPVVVVLTVVGALGFWQRTRILRRIGEGGSRAFAMLVAVGGVGPVRRRALSARARTILDMVPPGKR